MERGSGQEAGEVAAKDQLTVIVGHVGGVETDQVNVLLVGAGAIAPGQARRRERLPPRTLRSLSVM